MLALVAIRIGPDVRTWTKHHVLGPEVRRVAKVDSIFNVILAVCLLDGYAIVMSWPSRVSRVPALLL